MNTIVIGALNTDLVAAGLQKFPKSGELIYGEKLIIGPGGKSRNIADMIARLMPKESVAMIGRTTKDPYKLWKAPVEALNIAGVSTEFIKIVDFQIEQKLPGIALIPVNKNGENQIIVLPGISDDFSVGDIDDAKSLFEEVGSNQGVLVLTLECPIDTAEHAIQIANEHDIQVLFDPGGIQEGMKIDHLLQAGIFLIKPNEHEAKILTSVDVVDYDSAKQAAKKLQLMGIENVVITLGEKGAFLFTDGKEEHVPIPEGITGSEKDATGCGDQTIAAISASLQQGKSLLDAVQLGVYAGTLQFHRHGIQPIEVTDLDTQ